MRTVIETGLPAPTAPYEWAAAAKGLLYTVHVPLRPDGSAETGSATAQTEQTLRNLQQAVEAAGATLDDVVHVTIYLIGLRDKPAVDAVYLRYFTRPLPNRACIGISELALPDTMIEIVAVVALP